MYSVILCNGDFPRSQRCLAALESAEYLVCCDGAIAPLADWGRRYPDALVGDLDSVPPALKQKYSSISHQETEQDTNDLSKALRFCKAVRPNESILILGAGGKREDHLLGNISILADCPDGTELWTDYGRFLVVHKNATLSLIPGDQISFIAPDPSLPITVDGVKWPLKDTPLSHWWSGTLNEVTGNEVRISLEGDGALLVYLPWHECAGKAPLSECPRLPWRKVHFCGAGGVGVSGLAHLMLDAGVQVSGSDAVDSIYLSRLKERGAEVHVGENATNLPVDTDLLVYSAAVPPSNPERQQATNLEIPQCKRGEFLARVAPYFKHVIAVSGSHGKTSTSSLIAHVLKECGRRPGYLIGGNVPNWDANAAWGSGEIFVTEVDESDRSQELMLPYASIILNIDDDHSWAIGGTAGLEDCFQRLARQSHHVITWGTPDMHRILADIPQCQFCDDTTPFSDMPLSPVPGNHSRTNAYLAQETLKLLGITPAEFQEALNTFPGVDRRLTLLAQDGDKLLYEDYAHHPTELAACFQALRETHPGCKITAFFQPHRPERVLRYGTRFAEILANNCAKATVLAPFMAWETQAPDANPENIVAKINELRPGCADIHQGKPQELLPRVLEEWTAAQDKALFVFIGAGDVGTLAKLAKDALSINPNQEE